MHKVFIPTDRRTNLPNLDSFESKFGPFWMLSSAPFPMGWFKFLSILHIILTMGGPMPPSQLIAHTSWMFFHPPPRDLLPSHPWALAYNSLNSFPGSQPPQSLVLGFDGGDCCHRNIWDTDVIMLGGMCRMVIYPALQGTLTVFTNVTFFNNTLFTPKCPRFMTHSIVTLVCRT